MSLNNNTAGMQQKAAGTLKDEEFLYYSRQLLLPDWSETQQLLLKQKKLLVIGLGGLGCPAATYLSGAGVGELWLCDGDKVELSNLPRQPLYRPADVGQNKAEAAKAALQAYNPYIRLTAFAQYADEALLHLLLPKVDFVLDCSDSQATKLLLNLLCRQYQKAWAGASVVAYQGYSWLMPPTTTGGAQNTDHNIQHSIAPPTENKGADRAENQQIAPVMGCLLCLGQDLPLTPGGCASQGVFAPLVATLAMQLSSGALHYLRGAQQKGWFLLYQHQQQNFVPLTITADENCAVCQGGALPALPAYSSAAQSKTPQSSLPPQAFIAVCQHTAQITRSF
ncbi:ThiF family adenylyltransferase [Rheinheimera sp. 4Y26]|uniref:HesA/MoeB/ThiF family protein n=1 Tax=Rheinheimera sp. 4Y26 TaxID=2977811 RepID=UPI0021B10D5E|nr:ThiF family adenylyltransferase [Rheinheimera sp. 4Y26]MCT6699463.1 ThiF family adenylyltransferase [Rheinheimera sp. 4Y26]